VGYQGMQYAGSIIIPRRDFSYVVQIHAREVGMTGLRENLLVLRSDMASIREDAEERGIMPDPFELGFPFDREEYDALFPDHPVSRVRQHLRTLTTSLRIAAPVKAAAPFKGPGTSDRF
jgi:hypothetical protein